MKSTPAEFDDAIRRVVTSPYRDDCDLIIERVAHVQVRNGFLWATFIWVGGYILFRLLNHFQVF